MDKKIYQIDNRKPSLLPKIGSAVVAMGSLATAAAVASPNLISFSQATTELAQGAPTTDATSANLSAGNVYSVAIAPTLPSQQVTTETASGTQALIQVQTLAELPIATSNSTASPTPTATATMAPTPTSNSTLDPLAVLAPIGNAGTGNTSTATPVAGASSGGTSVGAGVTGSTALGNISNPTQASGSSYDDDDEYDDDHDHDDDHDDHDDHDDD